jgi:cardiolipin synthase
MHAKTITVDGEWSLVGSANLDSRSLALNFEVGLAVADSRIASQLESQFDEDLKDCLAIDPLTWDQRKTWQVLAENTFRMFAPIF